MLEEIPPGGSAGVSGSVSLELLENIFALVTRFILISVDCSQWPDLGIIEKKRTMQPI